MLSHPPIPENEIERLLNLSQLDLEESYVDKSLDDLTKLAAKIAGTTISLVNIVTATSQLSISAYQFPAGEMEREDSVCQHTIMGNDFFEVPNLSTDKRFQDKFYVDDNGEHKLRYYFGLPLKTDEGYNIGALCVLDQTAGIVITEHQKDLLTIIAKEIMQRLKSQKVTEALKMKVSETKEIQRKLVHDIRGPIGGIIGLSQIFKENYDESSKEEITEVFGLIEEGSKSLLVLADEILGTSKKEANSNELKTHQYNLLKLQEVLEKLYMPMAKNKHLDFAITLLPGNEMMPFAKNKLLQIIGNLISNATKFTPEGGSVQVKLAMVSTVLEKNLVIEVSDTGIGLSKKSIVAILDSNKSTTPGTNGEAGYGFGLPVVKALIENLGGTLNIASEVNKGASFYITIPQPIAKNAMQAWVMMDWNKVIV